MDDMSLTPKDVAELLGVTEAVARSCMASGEITSIDKSAGHLKARWFTSEKHVQEFKRRRLKSLQCAR